MRKMMLLAATLAAVAAALVPGPKPLAAAACDDCPASIGGNCVRISCEPCCYKCGKWTLCER
jgi:hypothetical protein